MCVTVFAFFTYLLTEFVLSHATNTVIPILNEPVVPEYIKPSSLLLSLSARLRLYAVSVHLLPPHPPPPPSFSHLKHTHTHHTQAHTQQRPKPPQGPARLPAPHRTSFRLQRCTYTTEMLSEEWNSSSAARTSCCTARCGLALTWTGRGGRPGQHRLQPGHPRLQPGHPRLQPGHPRLQPGCGARASAAVQWFELGSGAEARARARLVRRAPSCHADTRRRLRRRARPTGHRMRG